MTPTITPEALERAIKAARIAHYEKTGACGPVIADAIRAGILAALPELQAAPAAAGVPDALSDLYVSASRGFHITETCGPEGKYHHISKFRSIADLHAFADAWRAAMISARDTGPAQPAAQPQAEQQGAGDALPPLPIAFFDEFGRGADDRVQDYALAAIAVRHSANFASLREQAAAWIAVTDVIARLVPNWLNMGDTGIERAVAAIEALAARQPVGEPAAPQGVDLGQFREAVEYMADRERGTACTRYTKKLLALIDSQHQQQESGDAR